MLEGDAPQISVAVGVIVGLLASFVQSLGLTIQRKSHLQNEDLPHAQRKQDHRRPLWIAGFAIFICANLLGTIFQIGALPIVVLGPLGAVSLLYNAFFARVILGDEFSVHLVLGTVFIAGGAVLIGIFGVVPEQTHTLDELVRLYSRPAFLIWISLLSASLVVLLVTAHITEWAFERQCRRADDPTLPSTPRPTNMWRRRSRKATTPSPAAHLIHSPAQASPARRYGALDETTIAGRNPHVSSPSVDGPPEMASNNLWKRFTTSEDPEAADPDEPKPALSEAAIERTRVILGVAYGGASGTLSGLCLLFAKTGTELLILTVVGQNQFGHYQAWLIILVLFVAAILQLFYLNRALRLLGPHLVCPLAFCAYNLSSIISGLIYYDQWDMLSGLQFGLVSLGTVILLAGVWIVSNRADHKAAKEKSQTQGEYGMLLTEEPESDDDSDASSLQEPVEYIPRGLTIGLGAASPGFDIRPHRRHQRTVTLPSAVSPPLFDSPERPLLLHTASASDTDAAASELLSRRRRARESLHTRRVSISGGPWVGGRRHDSASAPTSPVVNSRLPEEEERQGGPPPPPPDFGVPPKPVARSSR